MADVTPRLKELVNCPCGCELVATLNKHTYKDGSRHVRGCKCAKCRGRLNRKSGLTAQRRAAKAIAVPKVGWSRPGNEEQYAGTCRIEVKSGVQVRPMVTAFEKAEKQSEAERPMGDNRPFVMAALPKPEGKDMIYAFRARSSQDVINIVVALAEQFGMEFK